MSAPSQSVRYRRACPSGVLNDEDGWLVGVVVSASDHSQRSPTWIDHRAVGPIGNCRSAGIGCPGYLDGRRFRASPDHRADVCSPEVALEEAEKRAGRTWCGGRRRLWQPRQVLNDGGIAPHPARAQTRPPAAARIHDRHPWPLYGTLRSCRFAGQSLKEKGAEPFGAQMGSSALFHATRSTATTGACPSPAIRRWLGLGPRRRSWPFRRSLENGWLQAKSCRVQGSVPLEQQWTHLHRRKTGGCQCPSTSASVTSLSRSRTDSFSSVGSRSGRLWLIS